MKIYGTKDHGKNNPFDEVLHFYNQIVCWNRYRLGSRFWVNETSQISERYNDQMQAVMKQNICSMFVQMYLSMIEYPKHDWHAVLGHKRRATAGSFILNLLYCSKFQKSTRRVGVKFWKRLFRDPREKFFNRKFFYRIFFKKYNLVLMLAI